MARQLFLSNKFIKSSSQSDSRHCGFHFMKGIIFMNTIGKSESIRTGLRKGFQDGTSKLSQRKCYGYDVGPNGDLTISPDEAIIVRWIFDQYLNGCSLGTIAAGLEKKVFSLPPERPNGTGRHSISCSPTKNTRGVCCSRKPSALVLPK